MGRDIDLTDGGIARFFEAIGNGTNKATLHAPALLAGDYDIELLDALPAGPEFLQINASGKLTTNPTGAGTLDQGYDSGGPGAGRIIVADSGAVEIQGVGGLLSAGLIEGTAGLRSTAAEPVVQFETTGVGVFNWRLIATAGDLFIIQRGDQDADVSDDVFETLLAVDAPGRMVGINTGSPQEFLHVNSAGLGVNSKVRIQADTAFDASVQFYEATLARFEIGYDDSAGGLVVGRVDFTNPVIFVEDVTGDVGIGELVPDARLHATSGASLVGLLEATVGTARLGLRDSATTDENTVGIQAVGNSLQLRAGSAVRLHVDTNGRVGIGQTTPLALLELENTLAVPGLLIDQDSNQPGLQIDSEATGEPLIDLLSIDGNSRGDIAFSGTARTSDPSAPQLGDIWLNTTTLRLMGRGGLENRTLLSRFGPSFGPAFTHTITAGVIALTRGHVVVAAETGTSDTLDTINASVAPFVDGDTILLTARSGDTITVSDSTGNIRLNNAANIALNTVNDTLVLVWRAAVSLWVQLSHSNNAT